MARRPPNSGTVRTSSISRAGSPATSSPSSRTMANGSRGSSTLARMIVSVRSRTSPRSGPKTSMTGRQAAGRVRNASTSPLFNATMMVQPVDLRWRPSRRRRWLVPPSGAGDEVGRKPRPDLIGDHFGGAGFGIAHRARAGKALLLAGSVVSHPGHGRSGHDVLAGSDLGQCEVGIEAEIVELGAQGDRIEDNRRAGSNKSNRQPVSR